MSATLSLSAIPMWTHASDSKSQYIMVTAAPDVLLDIRYATENNFMKKNVYKEFKGCFLHKEAFAKFTKARSLLKQSGTGYKFIIFDCLRPRSVQRELWSVVKGTDKQEFVADPDKGSVHNYGFAMDLSLADSYGKELDMGTPFDFFGDLARPTHENQFIKSGELTKIQLKRRLVLRKVMEDAGFIQLKHEWWHFDAEAGDVVRKNRVIVETLDEIKKM